MTEPVRHADADVTSGEAARRLALAQDMCTDLLDYVGDTADRDPKLNRIAANLLRVLLGHDTLAQGSRRVQIEGDLYHQRVPGGAVKATRPGRLGNPHPVDKPCKHCDGAVHAREESLRLFREHLDANPDLVVQVRRELKGRNLACWCKPDEACHVDTWLEYLAAGHHLDD